MEKEYIIKWKTITLRVNEDFFNKMKAHKEEKGFTTWESYIHALFMKGKYK